MKRVVNFQENDPANEAEWQFKDTKTENKKQKHNKKNEKFNAKTKRLSHADFVKKKEEMLAFRKQLPIYTGRDAIIQCLKENDTVIVMGETGSGKTTQIPQFLVEAGLASKDMGGVAVTQPRRVAAVNLAKRVAEETMTRLGSKVGYTVRFDDTSSPQTIIKYLTDGMLLREILSDELLLRYKVIVLDEAHERTLRTDMLFGMIKKIQKIRLEKHAEGGESIQPLKIVIMSATLDAEKFSEFFNNAKILYVSGRLYPVDTMFTVEPQADYLDACLVSIFQIHINNPRGDILVFLPGQDAIESLTALVSEYSAQLRPQQQRLLACPLFAALPPSQQQKVFDPAPENTRKVILSTNIAETSITIPGIKYVIDCGLAKLRGFNPKIGVESLLLHPISKSSAWQRTGRAGREAAGVCYRLYTEGAFRELEDDTVPEIRRCNLASAVLSLKATGINNILEFDYMDRPSRASLVRALEELYALGAIDDKGDLSDLGKQMAEFPLDPTYSKVLIQSKEYGCSLEVIAIISLLSVDSIFFTPSDKREQASEARKKFLHPDGDHLTLLNVLKSYWEVKGDIEWCKENFINNRNIKIALEVRDQLVRFCERIDMNANSTCGSDTDNILKCFLTGFFQNTALLQPDGSYKSVAGSQLVKIHPGSAMFGKRVEGIVYNELVFTTKHYVRGVSAIQSAWLPLAAPKYFNNFQQQQQTPQRIFHPQVAYPIMSNIMPSERTQGVFSTYPARLKHSDDNALLLPGSYVTKKTRFRGNESEDEFDQMMEESDDEDEDMSEENNDDSKKNSGDNTNATSNAATVATTAAAAAAAPSVAAPPPPADWPKLIRKKNDTVYSSLDLRKISETEEDLVPIRLDIDIDSVKLRDRFLWNLHEQYLTPDKFAAMLCQDLDLPHSKFIQPIADSIRAQIADFETYSQAKLPSEHTRLDLQVGKVNYRDQFEWELQNEKTNGPEVFSRQLASELGVGGEYVAIISHAIREQMFLHKKQYVDEFMMDAEIRTRLDNGFRPVEDAKRWAPRMDMLSNDELEKLLIAQERNIRRMRRETRFKRQTRGR
ncbi:hypothetical protein [Parasitella parasitica]|uniref:RNA helicase n=1 Tax=Parasitella parasitica TaxID=35722 RepID=A0A0B7MQR5_9FUNG|nr:hypothetical protein [Parasitella parasitica]